MQKVSDVAVVFAYRDNPLRDVSVLHSCIKAWQQLLPGAIYLADASETAKNLSNVRYIHRPYNGPFNLSFLRNLGVRKAIDDGFKYLQVMDADIFPSCSDYLSRCLKVAANYAMIMPLVIDSTSTVREFEVIGDENYQRFVSSGFDPNGRKFHSYSVSFQSSEIAKKIHGYDEEFEIWGGEDDDYMERTKQAGFKLGLLSQCSLIHSYHIKDTKDLSAQQTDQHKKNVARLSLTRQKKLPIQRMGPNWGLAKEPKSV